MITKNNEALSFMIPGYTINKDAQSAVHINQVDGAPQLKYDIASNSIKCILYLVIRKMQNQQ